MAVPELPRSRLPEGACNPRKPTPVTASLPSRGPSMDTPMARKAAAVASVSSPSRNPLISESPSAMEANMTDRWDMDLSPGTVMAPLKHPPGSIVNVVGACMNAMASADVGFPRVAIPQFFGTGEQLLDGGAVAVANGVDGNAEIPLKAIQ